jgi:hypothetical protein
MKSWFIGTISLKFSTKNKKTYLEGWDDKIPVLGFENHEIKNTFHLVLDFNKILWMHTHKQEATEQAEVTPEIAINQWVSRGKLKLKISTKSGTRFLEGWLGKNPVLGWEDKGMKNKFHLVIDDKKLVYLRTKNPDGADKAEVVSKKY